MSAAIAAIVAHVAFWFLLAYGWCWAEIGWRGAAVVLALWIGGYAASGFIPHGPAVFPSFVAILDIALVLVVFKGDLRLT